MADKHRTSDCQKLNEWPVMIEFYPDQIEDFRKAVELAEPWEVWRFLRFHTGDRSQETINILVEKLHQMGVYDVSDAPEAAWCTVRKLFREYIPAA